MGGFDAGCLGSVNLEGLEGVPEGGWGLGDKGEEGEKNKQDLRTHCLVLQDLLKLMLEECLERGVEVLWRHKVVGIGHTGLGQEGKGDMSNKGEEKGAWVDVEVSGEDGEVKEREKIGGEGCIVVGADGANSAVRKGLFGDEFPGFTWDRTIIATNVSRSVSKGSGKTLEALVV